MEVTKKLNDKTVLKIKTLYMNTSFDIQIFTFFYTDFTKFKAE